MSERFEMRVSEDLMARLDEARGVLPRATWIKRALEAALEDRPTLAPAPTPAPAVRSRAVAGQWNRVRRLGPES